jgi:hypothetical protein
MIGKYFKGDGLSRHCFDDLFVHASIVDTHATEYGERLEVKHALVSELRRSNAYFCLLLGPIHGWRQLRKNETQKCNLGPTTIS